MSSLTYRAATPSDCDVLVDLVNQSYRGAASERGWTNENAFLAGERTNASAINEIIDDDHSVLLVFFEGDDPALHGCVCLHRQVNSNSAYLGMLTVRPDLQGNGLGKKILSVAENYAKEQWNVNDIEITIVGQRTELLEFYARRGYRHTGAREPFPPQKYGFPKRIDLELLTFRKTLTGP